VVLPEDLRASGTELQVEIIYETAPGDECTAVQWLPPEQTAGKLHPYLFTQCQSTHCRSMVPCQDAPAVKVTYEANVTVPSPLVALMSAVGTGSETAGSHTTYSFIQKVPISAYLIALAAGNLESRDIGPRTRVWAEPSVVELAAYEFADTEMFVSTAEKLCGDYVWGRYDLLMLPPSFPYGGMENPCLTFVTPTLLAGDRSLSNVIAHEVAHSWTGNLVTNATWADFWLNEGFTVFIERRLIRKIFGEPTAALKQRAGWANLLRAVEHFGADHPFTRLHIPMENVDPDDCFSNVSYEKGCAFVSYLEDLVGGPDQFEPFLQAYLYRFQYGTVSHDQLRHFFEQYFADQGVSRDTLDEVDWDHWVHDPGMPDFEPKLDTRLIDAVQKCATEWIDYGKADSQLDQGWTSDQKLVLVETLLEAVVEHGVVFSLEVLDRIDQRYGFSATRNSEILFKWCLFMLRTGDTRKLDLVARFLSEQGRMKFVRPLYRQLLTSGEAARAVAQSTFALNRPQYHAIAQKMVARDLANAGLEPSSSSSSSVASGTSH